MARHDRDRSDDDKLNKEEVGVFLHNAQVVTSDPVSEARVPLLALYGRFVKEALLEDVEGGYLTLEELVFVLASVTFAVFTGDKNDDR